MKLYSIETENFKLDGGAMFGVVPKVIWNKKYPADDNNLISMSMRLMLIVDGERKILIDSGIGNKQNANFLKHYYLHGNETLEGSLNKLGYSCDDITDNILTHLHFDHCGGSVKYSDDKNKLIPVFKNAKYWVCKAQWENAIKPNPREKASYLAENYIPLFDSGLINFADENTEITKNITIKIFNGHTDGQIIPLIKTGKEIFVFMADLIPMTTHIHLPFIMSYDLRAIDTLNEKKVFLEEAVKNKYILFFEHDYYNECCRVEKTEKGFRAGKSFKLQDVFK